MGNCCEQIFGKNTTDLFKSLKKDNSSGDAFPINPLSNSLITTLPKNIDKLAKSENQEEFQKASFVLKELVTSTDILTAQNFFFNEIQLHRPTLSKIIETQTPEIFDAEYFAENIQKEVGFEMINILYQSFKTNFKADFIQFCYVNQVVYLYPSLDEYELIHYEAYNDIIFMIERLRTERILIINSRNMLNLRIIQRFGNDRILDIYHSVEFHRIAEHPTLKALWEDKIKNDPGSPIIMGNYFENRGNYCHVCSFSKVDFHFSISLKFAQLFLKRTFKKFLENLTDNFIRHFEDDVWNSGMRLLWFKDSLTGDLIKPSFVNDKSLSKFFIDIEEFKKNLHPPLPIKLEDFDEDKDENHTTGQIII